MSNEIGFALEIPKEVLDSLNKADKLVAKIAKTATTTSTSFNGDIKGMDANVRALINSLKEGNSLLSDFSGFGSLKQNLDDLKTSTNATTSQITSLIDKISEMFNKLDKGKKKDTEPEFSDSSLTAYLKKLKELRKEYADGLKTHEEYALSLDALNAQYRNAAKEAGVLGKNLGQYTALSEDAVDAFDKIASGSKNVKLPNYANELDLKNAIKYLKNLASELNVTSDGYKNIRKVISLYSEELKKVTNIGKEVTTPDEPIINPNSIDGLKKQIQELRALMGQADISAMSTERDAFGNQITQIDAYKKAIDALNAKIAQAQQSKPLSFIQINQMEEDTVNKITAKLKELQAYQKESKVDLADPQSVSQNTLLLKQIDDLKNKLKELSSLKKEVTKPALATFDSAMSLSDSADSISKRVVAIKALKEARDNLSSADVDYTEKVAKLNEAIRKNVASNNALTDNLKEQTKTRSKMLDITQQLARQAALIFSVSQIEGYISKLVEVRGEFELQQKSLQAIMQNKYEADKVFGQVVDLSVRSPFRMKELVSYTKQLAAYRVENDKLFDSTKMLADISAGLGVDMGRLILAYGQVKAANYLRGTELRQFSEAGINILGELAQYFSLLENRAISTAEVFEMVSNRMVKFEDVANIFQKMTSEGGIFFNMQEIQAETLAGQISNLYDAIDVMLNKIGKDNEGNIKGAIKVVRELVANYAEIEVALKAIVIAGGSWLAIQKAMNIAIAKNSVLAGAKTWRDLGAAMSLYNSNTRNATASTNLFTVASGKAFSVVKGLALTVRGLASAFMSALPFILIAGIVELYRQMTAASRAAEALNKDLRKIVNEDVFSLNKQIKGFEDLQVRLEMANEGSKDRADIISRLNSEYGEYLDFMVTEKTTAKELGEAYENVVGRLREKASTQALEKGIQAIDESFANRLDESRKLFETAISTGVTDLNKPLEGGGFKQLLTTKAEINDIYTLLESRTSELQKANKELVDEPLEWLDVLRDVTKEYYNIEKVGFSSSFESLTNITRTLVDRNEAIFKLGEDINIQTKATSKEREASIKILERENQLIKDKKALNAQANLSAFDRKTQMQKLQQDFDLDVIDIKAEFYWSDKKAKEEKDKILNWATSTTKDINKSFEEQIKIKLSFDEVSPEEKKRIQEIISELQITPQGQQEGYKAMSAGIQGDYDTFNDVYNQYLTQLNQGISINQEQLKNAKERIAIAEAQADAIGYILDVEQKISEVSADSVNQKIKEKFAVEDINRVFDNTLGLAVDLLDKEKTTAELISENKTEYDRVDDAIQVMNRSKLAGIAIDEMQLGQLKTELEIRKYLHTLLGGESLTGKTKEKKNTTLDQLKDQLALIRELNSEYEKQRKYSGKDEALETTLASYKDKIAKLGLTKVLKNQGLTDADVVNILNLDHFVQTARKAGKDGGIALADALGDYQVQLNIEAKITDLDAFKADLDGMIESYDLSIELQSMGFDENAINKLFPDFDTIMSLEGLSKRIEDEFKKIGAIDSQGLIDTDAISTEQLKVYQDLQSKLSDMQSKRMKDDSAELMKWLVKSKSDRLKLEEETTKALAAVNRSYQQGIISEEAKLRAESNIQSNFRSETAKLDFEDLKAMDLYKMAFEDLDRIGTKTINHLYGVLLNFKDASGEALDPESFNTLMGKIKDLRDEVISRNPFEALVNSINQYREATDALKQAEIDVQVTGVEETQARENLDTAKQEGDINKIAMAELLLAKAKERSAQASSDLADAESSRADAMSSAQAALDSAQSDFGAFENSVNGVIDVVRDFADGLGIALDPKTEAVLDGISQGFGVMAAVMGVVVTVLIAIEVAGEAAKATLLPLLAIGAALGAVFAVFKIHDAKRQEEIDAELKKVERLQKAYEELEYAFDLETNTKEMTKQVEEMKENTMEQVAALEKAIAAERDKKKADKAQIEEWREQQEELLKEMREFEHNKAVEAMGGVGFLNYKSMTEEFISAWEDLFLETGDGIEALEEKFEDMMLNIVRAQAMSKVADSLLKPFYEAVDEAVKDGVTDAEWSSLMSKIQQTAPELAKQLEELYKQFGFDGGGATSSLSELQRGIQAITEPTGQALESLLNSMRFDTNQQTILQTQIADSIDSIMMFATGFDSPMYMELHKQTGLLNSINVKLESVIASGHPTLNGDYIKVNM